MAVVFGLALFTAVASGASPGGGEPRAEGAAVEAMTAGASPPQPAAQPARQRRPNIVVITTDDQNPASLSPSTMPNVTRLLKSRGTTFTNYVASGPLCCPSRAVFLTGQYGHNNGVTWNNPGGYADLRDKENVLPAWLQRAGYRTAHVGRFLNLYDQAVPNPNQVAPGWDEWHSAIEPRSYFNYTLRVNGRAVRYGRRDGDYLTRVLNRTAVGMIRRHTPGRRPLFLSVDHFAPHGGPPNSPPCSATAVPDPRDRDLFRTKQLPRPASFNEADVSDKPSFISGRPRLGPAAVAAATARHRCRLASLAAVDRGVGQIHSALRRTGELDNTVIIFTADNGWFEGEHRIPKDKVVPYEENLRVPMIVRAPPGVLGSSSPRQIPQAVANIDVAPTLLRMAGASPCLGQRCRTLDGRSFLGLLRGTPGSWPANRGVLLELEVPEQRAEQYTPCDYEGIRTGGRVYIEHHSSTGASAGLCRPREETELYDLRDDPFQLTNLSPAAPGSPTESIERGLAARLDRLEHCAGVAGRDPLPPNGSFCE